MSWLRLQCLPTSEKHKLPDHGPETLDAARHHSREQEPQGAWVASSNPLPGKRV